MNTPIQEMKSDIVIEVENKFRALAERFQKIDDETQAYFIANTKMIGVPTHLIQSILNEEMRMTYEIIELRECFYKLQEVLLFRINNNEIDQSTLRNIKYLMSRVKNLENAFENLKKMYVSKNKKKKILQYIFPFLYFIR